jgi:hypothetical protein
LPNWWLYTMQIFLGVEPKPSVLCTEILTVRQKYFIKLPLAEARSTRGKGAPARRGSLHTGQGIFRNLPAACACLNSWTKGSTSRAFGNAEKIPLYTLLRIRGSSPTSELGDPLFIISCVTGGWNPLDPRSPYGGLKPPKGDHAHLRETLRSQRRPKRTLAGTHTCGTAPLHSV